MQIPQFFYIDIQLGEIQYGRHTEKKIYYTNTSGKKIKLYADAMGLHRKGNMKIFCEYPEIPPWKSIPMILYFSVEEDKEDRGMREREIPQVEYLYLSKKECLVLRISYVINPMNASDIEEKRKE